jgi:hypothetical protein
MDRNEIGRPPRWADALLRLFLSPEEAETESGDLLEAYRDSIHPLRGRRRANLWYVRQVAGYILRARVLQPQFWILAGLALCFLIIAVSLILFPVLLSGRRLAWVVVGAAIYGLSALARSRPATSEDATVLRLGTRYGLAVGAIEGFGLIAGNLKMWPGIPLVLLGVFLLPLVAGAHGAIKFWRVRSGARVAYCSGLISGLVVFPMIMVLGYTQAFLPGFPGAEIPRNHPYTAAEYQQVNVADSLGGGLAVAFFGAQFGAFGGALGGLAGLLLARTGRTPEEPSRILWSVLVLFAVVRLC